VKVELSLDGGLTFMSLLGGTSIDREDPRWGEFGWEIPPRIHDDGGNWLNTACEQAMVKVCDYNFPDDYLDVSPVFAIRDRSAVRFLAQRTGLARYNAWAAGSRVWVRIPVSGPYSAELYDMHGRLRAGVRGNGPSVAILAEGIPGGAYIARIFSAGRSPVIRICTNRND
jgi:hypothetical protein